MGQNTGANATDIEGTNVLQDCKDAEIVPAPKKGNPQSCDNWRCISLLNVVGKIFARNIRERLQIVAETILPEFQCGFRKRYDSVDMILVAKEFVEKRSEHGNKLFLLFVDLKKAYDLIPKNFLWRVL